MPSIECDHRSPILFAQIAFEAMGITCEACNVTLFELKSRRRSRAHIAFARQIAMYLAHVVGRMTLGEVSCAFERDRTTVGYACHTIEDRRDSPIFDRQIEFLEDELRERLRIIFTRLSRRPTPTARDTYAARAVLAQ